jgi:hypothetical protein
MSNEEQFQKMIKKIQALKESGNYDLSLEEDLSLAIMNLVSLEEHFFFTAKKTGKDEYFDFMQDVREVRKSLLEKMVMEHEGETWCISKHLLAASMRMIEVGTKYMSTGKKEEAEKIFSQAYRVYSLFWAIRLKLVDLSNVKKVGDNQLNVHDKTDSNKPWTAEDIVNKLVNCCNE